jgi:hypothetical protein
MPYYGKEYVKNGQQECEFQKCYGFMQNCWNFELNGMLRKTISGKSNEVNASFSGPIFMSQWQFFRGENQALSPKTISFMYEILRGPMMIL